MSKIFSALLLALLIITGPIGAQEIIQTDFQRAMISTQKTDSEELGKLKSRHFQGLSVGEAKIQDGKVVIEAELKFMEWYYAYLSAATRVGALLYRNGEYVGDLAASETEVLNKVVDENGNSDTYYRVKGVLVDNEPGPDPAANNYVVTAQYMGQHGNYHQIFEMIEVTPGSPGKSGGNTDTADTAGTATDKKPGAQEQMVSQTPAENSSVKQLDGKGNWEEIIPDPTLILKARYSGDMQTLILTPLVKVTRKDGSVLNYTDFMRDKYIIMDPETGAKLVLGLDGFEYIWFNSYRQGNEIHIPVKDLKPDESGNLRFHYLYYYTGGPTLGRRIGSTTVVKYPEYAARHQEFEERKKAAEELRKKSGQTLFEDPKKKLDLPGLDDANKSYDFGKKTYERAKQVQDLLQDVTGEKLVQFGKDMYGDYTSLSKSSTTSDNYSYEEQDRIDRDQFEAKKRGEEVVGGIIDKVKDKIKEKIGFIADWGGDWLKKKIAGKTYTADEEKVKKIEETKKELGTDSTRKADLYNELNNFQDERFKKPLELIESRADKLGVAGKIIKGARGLFDKMGSAVKGLFASKMDQSYVKVEQLIEEAYRSKGESWEGALALAKENYLEFDGVAYSRHGMTHSGKYGNDPGKYFDAFAEKIKYNKKAEWDTRYGKE